MCAPPFPIERLCAVSSIHLEDSRLVPTLLVLTTSPPDVRLAAGPRADEYVPELSSMLRLSSGENIFRSWSANLPSTKFAGAVTSNTGPATLRPVASDETV